MLNKKLIILSAVSTFITLLYFALYYYADKLYPEQFQKIELLENSFEKRCAFIQENMTDDRNDLFEISIYSMLEKLDETSKKRDETVKEIPALFRPSLRKLNCPIPNS